MLSYPVSFCIRFSPFFRFSHERERQIKGLWYGYSFFVPIRPVTVTAQLFGKRDGFCPSGLPSADSRYASKSKRKVGRGGHRRLWLLSVSRKAPGKWEPQSVLGDTVVNLCHFRHVGIQRKRLKCRSQATEECRNRKYHEQPLHKGATPQRPAFGHGRYRSMFNAP